MPLEFPLLYDDELLMSGCARYYDRQGYASPLDAAFDLFGREAIAAIANLPRGIGSLADQLPKGYPASVGDLLQKHTAFPYYAPFLPPQHVQALSDVMLDTTHSERGGSRLGRMSGRLYALSRVLRYCPACVSDDRTQTHGRECYWHRLHQLPGVLVCAKHQAWLEESSVPSWGTAETWVSAERAGLMTEPRSTVEHPWRERLEMITTESACLLSTPQLAPPNDRLTSNTQALLSSRGYISLLGVVCGTSLLKVVIEFFSPALLAMLGWQVNNPPERGRRIPQTTGNGIRVQLSQLGSRDETSTGKNTLPLLTILVSCCLGTSISKLLQEPSPSSYFNGYPITLAPRQWPCVNPMCIHYQVPTDAVVCLQAVSSRTRAHVTWRLKCSCGCRWTITRWLDAVRQGQERLTIIDHGKRWDDELRRVWLDESQTFEMITERLHMKPVLIRSKARNMNLPARYGMLSDVTFSERRSAQRRKWEMYVRSHPTVKVDDFGRGERALYCWLMKNDRPWFQSQFPRRPSESVAAQRRKKRQNAPEILADSMSMDGISTDMTRRRKVQSTPLGIFNDEELARQVRATSQRLIESGHPYQIHWQTLRKHIPQLPVQRGSLKLLPLTADAVREAKEPLEQVAARRILMLGHRMRQEGTILSLSELLKRASAYPYRDQAVVHQAVRLALNEMTDGISSDKAHRDAKRYVMKKSEGA